MLFSSAGVHPLLGSALLGKPSSYCKLLAIHSASLVGTGQPLEAVEGGVVLAVGWVPVGGACGRQNLVVPGCHEIS